MSPCFTACNSTQQWSSHHGRHDQRFCFAQIPQQAMQLSPSTFKAGRPVPGHQMSPSVRSGFAYINTHLGRNAHCTGTSLSCPASSPGYIVTSLDKRVPCAGGGRRPRRMVCRNCNAHQTPQWRCGPDGPRTLCNACGVRFKKGLPLTGAVKVAEGSSN